MAQVRVYLSVIAASIVCFLNESVVSMEHTVGDHYGWHTPAMPSFFQDWANGRTFTTGDKLVFEYATGTDNVVEVGIKDDFDECKQTNLVGTYDVGPTVLPLDKPGIRYFFSGLGQHCESAQKVAINVYPAPGTTSFETGVTFVNEDGELIINDASIAP